MNQLIKQFYKNTVNPYYMSLLYVLIVDNNLKSSTDIERFFVTKYIQQHHKSGKLYCLYNEVFKHYGDNVYKLGCSKHPNKRLGAYVTSYIESCEFKHVSETVPYYKIAEKILFSILQDKRIKPNKEFFKVELQTFIDTCGIIESELVTGNIYDLYIKYNLSIAKIDALRIAIVRFISKHHDTFSKIINIVNKEVVRDNVYRKDMNKIGIRLPVSDADSILNANSIDAKTLYNSMEAYYNKQLNKTQMASIEKGLIMNLFGFDTLDKQWLYDNINKINSVYNYRLLTGKMLIGDNEKRYLTNRLLMTDMIKQVLHQQGYIDIEKNLKEGTIIKRKLFEANLDLVKANCELFIDSYKSKKLLYVDKITAKNVKDYVGTMNTILKKWGIKMESVRDNTRDNQNGISKVVTLRDFRIVYINDIIR